MIVKDRTALATFMIVMIGFILSLNSCRKDYFIPVKISESDTLYFSTDIQPIFNGDCLGSGCHSVNGGVAPFLEQDLAWDNLIYGNYVDTLNPESSILYQRIDATSNIMPPAAKLPSGDIQKILIWIKQGALNN